MIRSNEGTTISQSTLNCELLKIKIVNLSLQFARIINESQWVRNAGCHPVTS
jgi:hypothetical protein